MTESPTTPQGLPNPSPHSLKNRIMRILWGCVQATLFRYSPRPMLRWRAFLLRLFGANITSKSRVYPKAKIWGPWNLTMEDHATIADDVDCYCVDRITIGAHTTISQYTYLCGATHDFEDISFKLQPMPITIGAHTTISQYTYLCGATHDFEDISFKLQPMPITIGSRVWIAADCFIAPGVTISDGAVIGARSSVFKDINPWTVNAGTPSKELRKRNHPLNPNPGNQP